MPEEDNESLEDLSVSYDQIDTEPLPEVKKVTQRAQERRYPNTEIRELYFAVYLGNFP